MPTDCGWKRDVYSLAISASLKPVRPPFSMTMITIREASTADRAGLPIVELTAAVKHGQAVRKARRI